MANQTRTCGLLVNLWGGWAQVLEIKSRGEREKGLNGYLNKMLYIKSGISDTDASVCLECWCFLGYRFLIYIQGTTAIQVCNSLRDFRLVGGSNVI